MSGPKADCGAAVTCVSLLGIVAELEKTMQCNCDLDNWEPERDTGHSWVCRIHKAAKAGVFPVRSESSGWDGEAVSSSTLLGYEPEMWTVRKDYIYAAITSIQDGVEYAAECLQEHDKRFGRTTRKNKLLAEIMEKDIAQMRLSLEWLRSLPNI